MNAPELALHHQRLTTRAAQLRDQIERAEAALAGDPETERLAAALATARAEHLDVKRALLERDREVEARRGRLQARRRDLMSGRISNPTELVRLNREVEALTAAVGREEDRELELMEREERLGVRLAGLEGDLEAARRRADETVPERRRALAERRADLAATEAEMEATWTRLPPEWQAAYRRVGPRQPNPVAEVVRGLCQACRVGVTSSGMQALRRGGLVHCENCGRLLVVA